MDLVEASCWRHGINTSHVPVDDQSRNYAEVMLKRIFDAACATLVDLRGVIPPKYIRDLVSTILKQSNHSATTAERDWHCPLSLWKGTTEPIDLS